MFHVILKMFSSPTLYLVLPLQTGSPGRGGVGVAYPQTQAKSPSPQGMMHPMVC